MAALFGFLDLVPTSEEGLPPTAEELEEALRPAQLTLVPSLLEDLTVALKPKIEGLAVASRIEGLPVAEGIDPSKGSEAGVKWFVEWERDSGVAMVDDRADFHQSGHIVQVKEGDPILGIVPPTR